jgi:eukaryotic-like serine/threonine-protein kinase
MPVPGSKIISIRDRKNDTFLPDIPLMLISRKTYMDIQAIFNAALEIKDADARAAFLDAACAGRPEIRERVDALLAADARDSKFLEGDAQPANTTPGSQTGQYIPNPSIDIGTVINNRYKIREKLGEGGMGTVYVVETITEVRALFALKLIKPGFDSRSVLARFDQERHALALMDHTNIARFIDAGTIETGQPFFVMELIKGIPITKFCDQERLTVEERLKLFQPVCKAVQHAHHKGIIHRDLKPGNILVALFDGVPVPKVIDFGVAKATLQPLTDQTIYSEINSIIGTLEYMAPEQAEVNSLDIDTRADLYALGVILYELLTGNLPFSRKELGAVAMIAMLDMIRTKEPPKPSTKLSSSGSLPSIAATRKIDPSDLMKKLKGEIDWIIMKCLEKERGRRYDGPNQLSDDIDNYLSNRPLIARPQSQAYRFKKFLRRNRGKVIAATVLLLSLVVGIVGTTWGMVQAIAAQREARSENEIQKSLLGFINQDLFSAIDLQERVDLGLPLDKDLKVRTLLDRSAKEIGNGRFENKPEIEAALRLTIGKAYSALGIYDESKQHLNKSVELRTSQLGANHKDTLESLAALGANYTSLGKFKEAQSILHSVWKQYGIIYGVQATQTVDALADLCWAEFHNNELAIAGTHTQELIELQKNVYAADQIEVLQAKQLYALILQKQGNLEQSAQLFREINEAGRKKYGDNHPTVMMIANNFAQNLHLSKKYSEAARIYQHLLPAAEQIYEADHVVLAAYRSSYATILIKMGQYSDAEKLLVLAIPVYKSRVGLNNENTLVSRSNFAYLKGKQKEYSTAIHEYLEIKPMFVEKYGYDSFRTENVLADMLTSYLANNSCDESLQLTSEYLKCYLAQGKGTSDNRMKRIMTSLSGLCKAHNRQNDMTKILSQAVATLPADSPLINEMNVFMQ